MRKILLTLALTSLNFLYSNAQGKFNLGFSIGSTINDDSGSSTFSVALEANYLFHITNNLKVGPSVSVLNYINSIADYAPVFLAARLNVFDNFLLGADAGYAIAIRENPNNGVFLRPSVGYNIDEKTLFQLYYSNISNDGSSLSSVGVIGTFQL